MIHVISTYPKLLKNTLNFKPLANRKIELRLKLFQDENKSLYYIRDQFLESDNFQTKKSTLLIQS